MKSSSLRVFTIRKGKLCLGWQIVLLPVCFSCVRNIVFFLSLVVCQNVKTKIDFVSVCVSLSILFFVSICQAYFNSIQFNLIQFNKTLLIL
jgi:hypothetical protein